MLKGGPSVAAMLGPGGPPITAKIAIDGLRGPLMTGTTYGRGPTVV